MFSVDGLVSGLDTSSLIAQLLELQRRPVTLAQNQVVAARQKQTAFLDLSARLINLQVSAKKLADPLTFRAVSTNSSDSTVLAASGSAGLPPGVYQFRVAQLARSSQYTSTGFADSDETAVGAGTFSLELGGFVDARTELDELNGGAGVSRGTFRVIDRTGASALIDVSAAVTVQDVIDAINNASGIEVTASISGSGGTRPGQALLLTDTSGGLGTLEVEDLNGLDVAADLGIVGVAAGATLEGSAIRTISNSTRLASLLDGLGARTGAGDDLVIAATALGGLTLDIDLDDAATVGEFLDAVNNHVNNTGEISMALNAAQNGFVITDTTGTGGITVTDGALSSVASDFGLAGVTAGTSVASAQLVAGMNDVLLSTLNGGAGVTLGSISIQSRAAVSGTTVSLASARSLSDVINTINSAGVGVTARLNAAGNGLELRDTSGGAGALTVAEVGGTTAAELGLLGSVTQNTLTGTDLNPRYVHQNTQLSTLNGGAGVEQGSIRITATNGVSFTVDLSQEDTIGEVINDIQGAATLAGLSGTFTVGLNSTGNGLAITDTSGAGTLRVDEVDGGSTASDLHIVGSAPDATPGAIDGAFQETITIGADDTLQDVRDAIAELGIDVQATIVNDGSAASPYRLNLVAGRSGSRARLLVETGGGTNLAFSRTSEARDGVLFYGESSASSEPVLLRSSTNTYRNVIDGLTVTALQTSATPVSVTVASDVENLTEKVSDFVDKFNDILSSIADVTAFNIETNERGVLLGDGTVRTMERTLLNKLIRPLSGISNALHLMSEIGIRLVNGRLSFNSTELEEALAEDPEAVTKLFSAARPLAADVELEDFNNGEGVRTAGGADFQIQLRNGATIDVDVSDLTTAEDVIDAINDAATAAGQSLTASLSSTQNSFVLTDGTTGGTTFKVVALNASSAAADLGLSKSADVAGGGLLTGSLLDLAGDPGVASRINDAIEELTDTEVGALQRRADAFDEIIESLNDRIERIEERLARRETALRRQFAQLEQVISSSQQTQQRLSAQLGGLGR
ncbi:MAG: flagellar filament capping protein FliD [Planctomycetota bacterium]